MSAITARETAALKGAAAAPAAHGEYLSFRLGTEEYGIEILRVQEIRGFEQPTRLAGAPESVCGVVNLRGAMTSSNYCSRPTSAWLTEQTRG